MTPEEQAAQRDKKIQDFIIKYTNIIWKNLTEANEECVREARKLHLEQCPFREHSRICELIFVQALSEKIFQQVALKLTVERTKREQNRT